MTALKFSQKHQVAELLTRIAYAEFELMDSCEDASSEADGEARAYLLEQAGAAQVHIFDLDSRLRALDEQPVTYLRCLRRSLRTLGSRPPRAAAAVVIAQYDRALQRHLPDELVELLAANRDEHVKLTV
jgi:hypothetical protein